MAKFCPNKVDVNSVPFLQYFAAAEDNTCYCAQSYTIYDCILQCHGRCVANFPVFLMLPSVVVPIGIFQSLRSCTVLKAFSSHCDAGAPL